MKWEEITKAPRPELEKVVFTYTQDGNGNGTTAEYEELEIRVEASLCNINDDHFFVLKSSTGWSVDNIEELVYLVEHTKKVLDEK
jgi:hypothetical protein